MPESSSAAFGSPIVELVDEPLPLLGRELLRHTVDSNPWAVSSRAFALKSIVSLEFFAVCRPVSWELGVHRAGIRRCSAGCRSADVGHPRQLPAGPNINSNQNLNRESVELYHISWS